jgi:hypothetical protein
MSVAELRRRVLRTHRCAMRLCVNRDLHKRNAIAVMAVRAPPSLSRRHHNTDPTGSSTMRVPAVLLTDNFARLF